MKFMLNSEVDVTFSLPSAREAAENEDGNIGKFTAIHILWGDYDDEKYVLLRDLITERVQDKYTEDTDDLALLATELRELADLIDKESLTRISPTAR